MKIKIRFSIYTFAVILISMFVIAGCSNDNDNAEPDDEIPVKVTDIDGNEYSTIKIGNQIWITENLRVSRYNNGDPIPTGLSDSAWSNTTEGAYAVYPHTGGFAEDDIEGIYSDAEMVDAYGKLYNWYAVNDQRGLCPAGWRVPGDGEWAYLVNHLAVQGFPNEMDNPNGAANALKSCRQDDSPWEGCGTSEHPRWSSDGTHHGFDEFGFSALPGGYRTSSWSFDRLGTGGYWWTSVQYYSSPTLAWSWSMGHFAGHVYRGSNKKTNGYSVRCISYLDK